MTEIEEDKCRIVLGVPENTSVPNFKENNDGENLTDQAAKPSEVGLSGQGTRFEKNKSGSNVAKCFKYIYEDYSKEKMKVKASLGWILVELLGGCPTSPTPYYLQTD